MEVDPRWLDVVAGRRYTQATAIERYPQLTKHSFVDETLAFEMARKPKTTKFTSATDVRTYLAADVDALAAEHAALETIDPRWLDVEAGRRFTQATAMQRYPQLNVRSFKDTTLAFEIARKPKTSKYASPCDVRTYLAADVDALAAERAALETIDPRWLDVEAGRRFTMKTAIKRYPQLNVHLFKDNTLAFEIARKPKTSKTSPCDVRTYLAADVDAFAAERATKKRARPAPQEPDPEPEPEEEQEEPSPVLAQVLAVPQEPSPLLAQVLAAPPPVLARVLARVPQEPEEEEEPVPWLAKLKSTHA